MLGQHHPLLLGHHARLLHARLLHAWRLCWHASSLSIHARWLASSILWPCHARLLGHHAPRLLGLRRCHSRSRRCIWGCSASSYAINNLLALHLEALKVLYLLGRPGDLGEGRVGIARPGLGSPHPWGARRRQPVGGDVARGQGAHLVEGGAGLRRVRGELAGTPAPLTRPGHRLLHHPRLLGHPLLGHGRLLLLPHPRLGLGHHAGLLHPHAGPTLLLLLLHHLLPLHQLPLLLLLDLVLLEFL